MNCPLAFRPRIAILRTVLAVLPAILAARAFAWGPGHRCITEGALAVLPAWEKELLGKELDLLGRQHCVIPDEVYAKKEIRKYAMLDSKPDVFYLVELHLPATPPENYEILRFFLGKAVGEFKAGRVDEGARYLGTLVHAVEDWGCPAHSVPGDNMFTFTKQLLPPNEHYRHLPMHGPIEDAVFDVKLGDYRPKLLGLTVDEAAFNLLHAVQQSTIHARAQVIPIMQALYAADNDAAAAAQQKAGVYDAAVVADAIHTALSLARSRFEPQDAAALREVDLSPRAPLEAPNLFMPQTAFFGKPYFGYPIRGVCLCQGTNAVAIRIRTADNAIKSIEDAIGVGTTSKLTYLLPPGVYDRFEATVGLHADLGRGGNVIFEVKAADGKTLAKAQVSGTQPAQQLVVPLAGQTRIQLVATSGGPDASFNHAVWAQPRLVKK